ncbi:surfeit locus protein 2-like [Durio zibethinus]|uniref:Surfeit locus protein 2-like n=1 Tax=Durio zibethinus TaxID=66656 RepID=A0A6P5YH21_DURZI|nr:surfeit locus protein 2-like [Durio zibethinus]
MEEAREEKKGSGGGSSSSKEGINLLGPPTFTELPNGRLKCVETGHEMVVGDKDSYAQSKRCRLGLIDFALSHSKPPLNMFKQDPLSRSKLICKLTGDTVNKSEEHIWKHINGKRFLNKLEQKEKEKDLMNETMAEEGEQKPKKEKKKKNKKGKTVEEIISEVRDSAENESDSEEPEFWMPSMGERWDFDDGRDRWGSPSKLEDRDKEKDAEAVAEEGGKESEELSTRTKRMSIEIGPSSFASRKKKSRKNTS